jgi:hypothetical protein
MCATFRLIEPFDIDDDELEGTSAQECFSMGVEWQMFREKLSDGQAFACLVTFGNAQRLMELAKRNNRFAESVPIDDYWTQITVG